MADFNATRGGHELPDERYLFLSDILPTAWQGVAEDSCTKVVLTP